MLKKCGVTIGLISIFFAVSVQTASAFHCVRYCLSNYNSNSIGTNRNYYSGRSNYGGRYGGNSNAYSNYYNWYYNQYIPYYYSYYGY